MFLLLKLSPLKLFSLKKIPVKNGKCLERKSFDSIEKTVKWLTANQDTFVELTLESETFLTADERKRLYQSHSGIVHLIPKVKNQELHENQLRDINLNQDIQSLFRDYFKSKNGGQDANEELIHLFNEILNP